MRKIRIARNKVGLRNALFRFNKLIFAVLDLTIVKPSLRAEQERLAFVRLAKVRKDTEVQEMRRQKLCNDLVLQDLKIEEKKRELGEGSTPMPAEWKKPGDWWTPP